MILPADLPDLPVRGALDEVTGVLDTHGSAVLVAPPGTGKTTLVPLALAAGTAGTNVLVAEPRRLATRAAAARMAALLGEPVGQVVSLNGGGHPQVHTVPGAGDDGEAGSELQVSVVQTDHDQLVPCVQRF